MSPTTACLEVAYAAIPASDVRHNARVEDEASAVAHGGERVLGDEEGAADVHGKHAIEDVLRVLGDRRGDPEDAGVGEGDVEAAEALDGKRDGGLDLS